MCATYLSRSVDRALVGLQVVVAVGQAQGRPDPTVAICLRRVALSRSATPKRKSAGTPIVVQMRDEHRQIVGVERAPRWSPDRGASGASAGRFDRRLVHAGGVVVGRLLRDRGPRVARRRFEDAAQDREVAILHLGEASVRPPIGGHRVLRDPAAAGELVEVGARIGLAVERVQIDAGRAGCWRRAASASRRQPLKGCATASASATLARCASGDEHAAVVAFVAQPFRAASWAERNSPASGSRHTSGRRSGGAWFPSCRPQLQLWLATGRRTPTS